MPEQQLPLVLRLLGQLGDDTGEPVLATVAAQAVVAIPGCHQAGVSVHERESGISTMASTHGNVENFDALQHELDEGPLMDAPSLGDTYRSADLGRDGRWPRWGPRVAEGGMRSVITVRIAESAGANGVLAVYGEGADAFDDHARDLATMFGYHAAIALLGAGVGEGLSSPLHTRHTVGLAQGILMNEYGISAHHAFSFLRLIADDRRLALRDLAALVVELGAIPSESWSFTSNGGIPDEHVDAPQTSTDGGRTD